jgi:hypothetical protein
LRPRRPRGGHHILYVEIADAPGLDQTVAVQRLESGKRLLQGMRTAPMQEIESMPRGFKLRLQAAMVPAREEFSGFTLLTMKT